MVAEKAIADYTDFRIPGIVATNRGTLLRYCECRRSRSDWADIDIKKRGLAKSTDGISAWYELCFEENLSDPVCMGSMTHRNGRIYHSNCDSMTERKNLTIKISDDNFKTCRSFLVSDIGGYSDIALLGEKICIFYEKPNVTGAFELFFEVIAVE